MPYPANKVIQPLNNWGLDNYCNVFVDTNDFSVFLKGDTKVEFDCPYSGMGINGIASRFHL